MFAKRQRFKPKGKAIQIEKDDISFEPEKKEKIDNNKNDNEEKNINNNDKKDNKEPISINNNDKEIKNIFLNKKHKNPVQYSTDDINQESINKIKEIFKPEERKKELTKNELLHAKYDQKNESHPEDEAARQKETQNKVSNTSKNTTKGAYFYKVNCRFDYAGGICKDFKETGYCGFGENCIFAHVRGDYKTGWELEMEWEQKMREKERKEKLGIKEEEGSCSSDECNCNHNDNNNEIKYRCGICKTENMKEPVSTLCNHYFCEKCAIDRYKVNELCAICKQDTKGVFNNAEKIVGFNKKVGNIHKNSKIIKSILEKKNKNLCKYEENTYNNDEDKIKNIEDEGNMDYLDNRQRDYDIGLKEDDKDTTDFNENIVFDNKKGKKKEKFKLMNDWIYESNYKSYD